jgi:hypothetical protein
MWWFEDVGKVKNETSTKYIEYRTQRQRYRKTDEIKYGHAVAALQLCNNSSTPALFSFVGFWIN